MISRLLLGLCAYVSAGALLVGCASAPESQSSTPSPEQTAPTPTQSDATADADAKPQPEDEFTSEDEYVITDWEEVSLIDGPVEDWMSEQCDDVTETLEEMQGRIDKERTRLVKVLRKSIGAQVAFAIAGKANAPQWTGIPDALLWDKYLLGVDTDSPRIENRIAIQDGFATDLLTACGVAEEWEQMESDLRALSGSRSKLKSSTKQYMSASYQDPYTQSCMAKANERGKPARKNNFIWYQEDTYTNSGDLWVSFNLVNYCGRPVRAFEYRLTLTDAFGDQIFSGNGKMISDSPIKPGKSYKVNRNGNDGVFSLAGTRWFDLMQWWDSRQTQATDATWETTITQILYD